MTPGSSTLQTILHYVLGVLVITAFVVLALDGSHVITGADAVQGIYFVAGILLGTGAATVGSNLTAKAASTIPPAQAEPPPVPDA